ncbi:Plasma membrane low glucose sensor [Rhodotorula toruloides]
MEVEQRAPIHMALLMSCFAGFGGFIYGYDTGYISGVKEMPYFRQLFGELGANGKYYLPSYRDSLITSILSAGTFVGALASYPIGDFLGRRYGIMAFLFLFSIGVACQTGGTTLRTFVVGRIFAGLGIGGTSCLVPVYQSETAPKHLRGAVVGGYQLLITVGLFIAAVIVNGTKNRMDISCYAIPIGLQFIWVAILVVGLAILPESPRYLIAAGRDEAAQDALSWILRAPVESDIVGEHYAEIAASVHHVRSLGGTSYADCFSMMNRNRVRSWAGIGLQALQQLVGVNFIFYYGTTFFQNSGIHDPFVITIATNVVNVGSTIPGLWLTDKAGRRTMLLVGAVGMAVCHFIVAGCSTALSQDNEAGQKVLIGFVCVFIAFFAATWGPIAWVVTSEIYATATRAKQMSMSVASNWLFNFGIGYATPYLVNTGKGNAGLQGKVFFIWGGVSCIAILFVYFCIPETKGLSLEQIDILYRLTGNAIRATKIRRELLDRDIQDEDTAAYFYAFKEQHLGSSLHELEQHQGSSSDPQQPPHHQLQLQQDGLAPVESPAVKMRDLNEA